MTRPFDKTWAKIEEQLAVLTERGLAIPDPAQAAKTLGHVGYYRLSGYCLAFEDGQRHVFRDGTTFDQVLAAYEFDCQLRDALSDASEVIELDLRATVAAVVGEHGGAFGHADPANFRGSFKHAAWLDELETQVRRSRDRFVTHFENTYEEYPLLPCWASVELMSFGSLSMLVDGLGDKFQSKIANAYGQQKADFASALHHLVHIRNRCAHHARVWDTDAAITPRLPIGNMWQPPTVPEPNRIYVGLLLTFRILKRIRYHATFAAKWRQRIVDLIASAPTDDALDRMGMPEKWFLHPAWT